MNKLIFFVCILVLYACKPDRADNEILVFDIIGNLDTRVDTTKTWNDFASSVEVIPLETNDSNLLSSFTIQNVVGDRIVGLNRLGITRDGITFFTSGGKADIRIFDTQGKLIRTIDRMGKGGREYPALDNLWVGQDPLCFKIATNGKLYAYDEYGEYQGTDSLDLTASAVYLGEGKYLAEVSAFSKNQYKCQLLVLDEKGKAREKLLPEKIDSVRLSSVSFSLHGKMASSPQGVFYKNAISDTVYLISPHQVPRAVAVFPSGTAKQENFSNGNSLNDFTKWMGERLMVSYYYPFGDKYYISYSFKGKSYTELWEKGNNKPLARNLGLKLKSGKKISAKPQWMFDHKAYFLVDAYKVVDEVEGITEDSNPVLIIVTLK